MTDLQSHRAYVVQGCITYAAAQEDVEQVCQAILASGAQALGFDVEWHVTYRRVLTPIRQETDKSCCDRQQAS